MVISPGPIGIEWDQKGVVHGVVIEETAYFNWQPNQNTKYISDYPKIFLIIKYI